MKLQKLLPACAAAAALILSSGPAEATTAALSEVSGKVSVRGDYSACATVKRTNKRFISATLTSTGYQTQGLATSEIDASDYDYGYGSVTVCTSGGFTTQHGEATFNLSWSSGAVSGSLPVQCTTVNYFMQCSQTEFTLADADPS
jgi:hypothetical protein